MGIGKVTQSTWSWEQQFGIEIELMLEKLKSKSLYYFPWPVGTNDRLMKKDFGTFQKVLIGFVNFSVVPKMLCASGRGHRDCCGYILLVRCEI